MTSITVYADSNYSGKNQILSQGRYDMDQLGVVGNDAISSLKVPDGWSVTLYEHAGFQGRSKVVTSDTPMLDGGFNDVVSSIVVSEPVTQGAGAVTVYADANFSGKNQVLQPGRYDMAALGIVGNDAISSLKIPAGWSVTLYEHAGFQGRSKRIAADTVMLDDGFNDLASSIVVENTGGAAPLAAVFSDGNYSGNRQVLSPGRYDMTALDIVGNDTISSIQVPAGWSVTLYEHAGFQGRSKVVTADTPMLGDGFNDLASSLVVSNVAVAAPVLAAALEPVTPSATLTGFDMVWAITQNTVNSQLAWLQSCKLIPSDVQIGDLGRDGLQIGGSDADRATIAPPTVEFDTGNAHEARLMISISGGNVSYYSGFGAKAIVVKEAIAGWKLAFNVKLNIGQIAHEHLTGGDGKVPPEILKILTQFDSTMFSIQSIFLDFQNSDMANYNTVLSSINTTNSFLQQNFATMVGSWIKSHQGADNPFILGYPVTRLAPPAELKAVFEPTGANLSTHAYEHPAGDNDKSKAGLSTLNFLLVTGDRKITDNPALYAADAGSFHRNLVLSNDIDGKGIIARDLFFKRYLKPLLIEPFENAVNKLPDYLNARRDRNAEAAINSKSGVSGAPKGQRARFVPSATGWTYADHVRLAWHESGFNSHDRESEQELKFNVDVSMQPDTAGASRLTLDIAGSLMRYEWDQVNQDFPFKNNVYMGKGWARATLRWSIRLQFIAGTDGKITITHSSKAAEPVKESGTGGVYSVADFFTDLLGLHGVSDDWRDNAAGLSSIDQGVVTQLIAATSPIMDAASTRIVMPAHSQFFYKNMLMNADGDIEIDFAYKSAS
ncbi:beta/gamma crystallin-related protein [Janthinobacterium sp.]|uniref:beta/gamma crystallin-related protein n=1 Tax=Janthinobacterium sp. TaxID=1871054 RepID=UPI00260A66E6|nr:beta/gamma crystallin-related protein [Janthinobacterium sp.]